MGDGFKKISTLTLQAKGGMVKGFEATRPPPPLVVCFREPKPTKSLGEVFCSKDTHKQPNTAFSMPHF